MTASSERVGSDPDSAELTTVICIHGLWMNGMEMALLRRRLRRHGFPVIQFSYHSITEGLGEHTRRLSNFIERQETERVHLVGHSLGGVLALQTLKRFPTRDVDRVVCLGSPLSGSRVVERLNERKWGNWLVGKTLHEATVDNPMRSANLGHQIGAIGGSLALGAGMLIAPLDAPNDGVVELKEMDLPGLADQIVMPVNHFGLLLSNRVAGQTIRFLRTGRFDHGD